MDQTTSLDVSKTELNRHMTDIVSDLLCRPFISRTPKEQHVIVKAGRSTPDLRFHPRHFSRDRYYIHPWLSGSTTLNCIVCWPCLLFKPNPGNVWTNGGFNQMNTFTQSAQSHQCAPEHAEALIQYNLFEQNVRYHELEYISHNERVQKNRDILKRLIDICSMLNQDFSFGRSECSANKTSNAELLQYITPLDDVLQDHLDSSPIFYNMPYNIQENILSSISSAIDNAIRQEVNGARFVAVITDDLSDVGSKSQLCITLRYVAKGGLKERLLRIYDNEDRTAKGISDVVIHTLKEYNCLSKLVAHSYDGASVSSSELREIQSLVRKQVPSAVLVHCYAHDLNHTLRESLSFLPQCKVFFSVVQGISGFFSTSGKHTKLLDQMVSAGLPEIKPIQWKHQWVVNIIHANRTEIVNLLEQILEHPDEWETETISSSKQLLNTMEDFEFSFLLAVFATVFEKMYTMYTTLKEGNFYLGYCGRVVNEGINFLSDQYKKFEEIYEKVVDDVGPPTKRKVARQVKEYYKMFFIRIIDCLKMQLELRFSYILDQKLQFNSLLDPTQFETFSKKRYDHEIKLLRESYDKHFDLSRLKNELNALYKRDHLFNKTLMEVHQLLATGELSSGFPQCLKLAELILTIPTVTLTNDGGQSSTYLTRIKKYCDNVSREDRVTALAKMAVEKDLLATIKAGPDFHDGVAEEFLKLAPIDDFMYK